MSVRKFSAEHSNERLAERRRQNRRRAAIALLVLALLLIIGAIWGTWQKAVRVSHVTIFGPPSLGSYGRASADSLTALTNDAMRGTYFGLVPKNSIFFVPEHDIRTAILASDSHIGSISIFREGFTGLSIQVNERTAVARWCGATRFDLSATSSRFNLATNCYLFDANGLVFSLASTSDQVVAPFTLYAPLAASSPDPLRATIADADALPATFDFARQVGTLGSLVSTIVIRGDPPSQGSGEAGEVDQYLTSGTRITYVLGQETDAFTALMAAKSEVNLADGSILYVDLRFPGKVYFKKTAQK